MSPVHSGVHRGSLRGLAGRWMAVKDGSNEGMVLVSEEGLVTFVGEAGSELWIAPDPGSRRSSSDAPSACPSPRFVLREQEEQLGIMRYECPADGGPELLHLTGQDGGEETWHRVQDGSPHGSPVRHTATDLKRRWTKEGQAELAARARWAREAADDDDDDDGGPVVRLPTGDAGFALDVALAELAGRWMAVLDGEDASMILISESGGVTFVGDAVEAGDLQIMVDPSEPSCFAMYEGTERIAGLRFQRPPDGPELLHADSDQASGVEVWRRLGGPGCPTPSNAAHVRRVPARDIRRRYTKQGQVVGPPTLPEPTFGVPSDEPAKLEELAGRWMVFKDGHEEGMVLMSSEGDVTFVGESVAAPLRLAAGSSPGEFTMCEDGEQIATVEYRPPAGEDLERLVVLGKDSESEVWQRVAGQPASP